MCVLIMQFSHFSFYAHTFDTRSGCTGWNIEVISYTSSLEDYVDMHVIGGDNCFCPGFPTSTSDAVERMRLKSFDKIHARTQVTTV